MPCLRMKEWTIDQFCQFPVKPAGTVATRQMALKADYICLSAYTVQINDSLLEKN